MAFTDSDRALMLSYGLGALHKEYGEQVVRALLVPRVTDSRPAGAPKLGAASAPPGFRPDAPWLAPTTAFPVNPFALASLKTGRKIETEGDLERAFALPLNAILAVGGPLYAPDLAAWAPPSSATVDAEPRVPFGMSPAGAPFGLAPRPPPALARADVDLVHLNPLQPFATPVSAFARFGGSGGEARPNSRPNSRDVRDPEELLRRMGVTPVYWLLLTCAQQFNLLAGIDGPPSLAPATDETAARRARWEQWEAIYLRYGRAPGDACDRPLGCVQWLNPGAWADFPVTAYDAQQGCLGNCYFIASLAGAAWIRPDGIRAGHWAGVGPVQASGGAGLRGVIFYDAAARTDHAVTISERVPFRLTAAEPCDDAMPLFARGIDPRQSWCAYYEKAMSSFVRRMRTGRAPDPGSDRGGYASEDYHVETHPALNIAGGDGVTHLWWRYGGDEDITVDELWRFLQDHCDATGKVTSVLGASTILSPGPTLVPNHVYTVLGIAVQGGRRNVFLRNPHGHLAPRGAAALGGTWRGLTLGLGGVGVLDVESVHRNCYNVAGNWYAPSRSRYDGPPHQRTRNIFDY